MYKKIAVILAGASVLASAGLALAAPHELNMFGASAEFDFWSANAVPYLTSLGCTVAPANTRTVALTTSTGNTIKHGFAYGTACGAKVALNGGTREVMLRYAGIASGEGVWAVAGKTPLEPQLVNYPAITGPNSCVAANGERAMLASGTSNDLECHVVNMGTADVSGKNINQVVDDTVFTDAGQIILTTYPKNDSRYPGKMDELANVANDSATYKDDQAVVVPFCLYVNNNVKAHHCLDSAGKRTGQYCTTVADCTNPGTQFATPLTCEGTATTIDRLTRLETVMLFSGQTPSWKYLGDYFGQNNMVNNASVCTGDANYDGADCVGTAADIVTKVCHRIPGSGTLATLDKTIMTAGGTNWGTGIVTANCTDAACMPMVQFNKSTGDMKTCLTSAPGAVGYMDCDQSQAGTTMVAYNGNMATRSAIRNGIYDFYAAGHIYSKKSATEASLIADMVAYAKKPANVPSGKAPWWCALEEMKYYRGSDTSYPVYQGANTPLLP